MPDAPAASVIFPTRRRAGYLEVALASIAPQAQRAGAELVVVDDGAGDPAAELVARRFGARYETYPQPRGLNAARNVGIAASATPLLVFVDDDVEAPDGCAFPTSCRPARRTGRGRRRGALA